MVGLEWNAVLKQATVHIPTNYDLRNYELCVSSSLGHAHEIAIHISKYIHLHTYRRSACRADALVNAHAHTHTCTCIKHAHINTRVHYNRGIWRNFLFPSKLKINK